jgi:hypothetical protein
MFVERRSNCKCNLLFTIIVLVLLLWVFLFYVLISGYSERAKISARADVLESLQDANKKGKRNTYCDHLRHLVLLHGMNKSLISECEGKPITDLQERLNYVD